MNKLLIEILKGHWLLAPDKVAQYEAIAIDILAGKNISTGLFSSLELPAVPDNVALIPMVGVLTKSDVCNSQGSASLARMVAAAAANPNYDAIIVLSENCPGGQVDGTEALGNAVKAAAQVKPVYGAISGMAASAGVWVLSQCTSIFATSATDTYGCIGVMSRMNTGKDGSDTVDVISDLSPDKNIEGRDAQAYKDNLLNPMAQLFHSAVTQGRGSRLKLKKENVLSGKQYMAAAATEHGLIDGIKPFDQIISIALKDAKKRKMNMKAITSFALVTAATGLTNIEPLVAGVATETTENGYLVPEAAMDAIEAAMAAQAAAQAPSTARIAELEAAATAAALQLTAAQAATTTATRALTTAQARITELEAQDGATGAAAAREKDDLPGGKTDPFTDPNSSLNKAAAEYGV